jgi:hypothetical protein
LGGNRIELNCSRVARSLHEKFRAVDTALLPGPNQNIQLASHTKHNSFAY